MLNCYLQISGWAERARNGDWGATSFYKETWVRDYWSAQGRRKHLKFFFGGAGFEGHFSNERASKIWCFSRKWKTFCGHNINSSFQKCPLGKKCNLNEIFHARKGHFAPGKRALWKTWGAWPSRFLRPWISRQFTEMWNNVNSLVNYLVVNSLVAK